MRKFDTLGLRLAEFQAKLFEASVDKAECSSLVFIRRFKKSRLASKLDEAKSDVLLDVDYSLKIIEEQFGSSSYGSNNYSKEAMFWLGYIYRYISYTRDISTKKLLAVFEPKEVIKYYYVFHTQSEEWVIQELLELKGLDESFFDKNASIKKKLFERYKMMF